MLCEHQHETLGKFLHTCTHLTDYKEAKMNVFGFHFGLYSNHRVVWELFFHKKPRDKWQLMCVTLRHSLTIVDVSDSKLIATFDEIQKLVDAKGKKYERSYLH
jgi:hypothetical protein